MMLPCAVAKPKLARCAYLIIWWAGENRWTMSKGRAGC